MSTRLEHPGNYRSLSGTERMSRASLYIAGLGACAAGLTMMGVTSGDFVFGLITCVLVACGFYASWVKRYGLRKPVVPLLYVYMTALVFGVFYVMQFVSLGDVTGWSVFVAMGLPALMVAVSFMLKSDWTVLFICVLSVCIMLFSLTLSPVGHPLFHFSLGIALTGYVMAQQNLLSDRRKSMGSSTPMALYARAVAAIAAVTIIVAAIVGLIVYPPVDEMLWKSENAKAEEYSELEPTDMAQVASGPNQQGEREVMRVKSPEPLYWRGQVFARYRDGYWTSGQESVKGGMRSQRGFTFRIPKGLMYEGLGPAKRVRQEFDFPSDSASLVFAANEPETISFRMPSILRTTDTGLQKQTIMDPGYTVTSRVSTATERQLRSASRRYPRGIAALYLDDTMPSGRVSRLARQITWMHRSPYDKAAAIRQYLIRNYEYDLNVAAPPAGEDPVEYFLFTSKRGYCDVYSSSMVMMLRSVGVPARWATGFSPGRYENQDGLYHVMASNSHAWVEAYFPGYGWIEFDPTIIPISQQHLAHKLQSLLTRIRTFLQVNAYSLLVGVVILLLLVYLVRNELMSRRHPVEKPHRLPATENYRRMCQLFGRYGYPRSSWMTPLEYSARLAGLFNGSLGPLPDTVGILTRDFIDTRYAAQDVPEERIQAGRDALASLKRSLETARRKKVLPPGMEASVRELEVGG